MGKEINCYVEFEQLARQKSERKRVKGKVRKKARTYKYLKGPVETIALQTSWWSWAQTHCTVSMRTVTDFHVIKRCHTTALIAAVVREWNTVVKLRKSST